MFSGKFLTSSIYEKIVRFLFYIKFIFVSLSAAEKHMANDSVFGYVLGNLPSLNFSRYSIEVLVTLLVRCLNLFCLSAVLFVDGERLIT